MRSGHGAGDWTCKCDVVFDFGGQARGDLGAFEPLDVGSPADDAEEAQHGLEPELAGSEHRAGVACVHGSGVEPDLDRVDDRAHNVQDRGDGLPLGGGVVLVGGERGGVCDDGDVQDPVERVDGDLGPARHRQLPRRVERVAHEPAQPLLRRRRHVRRVQLPATELRVRAHGHDVGRIERHVRPLSLERGLLPVRAARGGPCVVQRRRVFVGLGDAHARPDARQRSFAPRPRRRRRVLLRRVWRDHESGFADRVRKFHRVFVQFEVSKLRFAVLTLFAHALEGSLRRFEPRWSVLGRQHGVERKYLGKVAWSVGDGARFEMV
eukprot:2901596-Rhodomonas_salina.4